MLESLILPVTFGAAVSLSAVAQPADSRPAIAHAVLSERANQLLTFPANHNKIGVWDVRSGELIRWIEYSPAKYDSVHSAVLSPDAKNAAIVRTGVGISQGPTLAILNIETSHQALALSGNYNVSWGDEETMLFSMTDIDTTDPVVTSYFLRGSLRPSQRMVLPQNCRIDALCALDSKRVVLCARTDTELVKWNAPSELTIVGYDLPRGSEIRRSASRLRRTHLAFPVITKSDNGQRVAIGAGRFIELFEIDSLRLLRRFEIDVVDSAVFPTNSIEMFQMPTAISASGRLIAAGGAALRVFDVESGRLVMHERKLQEACMLPDRIQDPRKKSLGIVESWHEDQICSLSFFQDDTRLLAVGVNGFVQIWDLTHGLLEKSFRVWVRDDVPDQHRRRDTALDDLIQGLRHDDASNRRAAAYDLLRTGTYSPKILDLWQETLNDSDPFVRRVAICALVGTRRLPENASQRLTELLQDSDQGVSRAALSAILRLRIAPQIPVGELDKLLSNRDPFIQCGAMQALATHGPRTALSAPTLARFLVIPRSFEDSEGSMTIREAAITALHAIGKDSSVALASIINALDDRSSSVREKACLCLAAIGADARSASAVLRRLLDDKDPGVRSAARLALMNIEPD